MEDSLTLKSGDSVEFQSQPPITREQLRAYAAASGDFNPIHLDEQVAKRAGLPGVIAHGMLTAAFIGERARQVASGGDWKLAQLQTRFKAMTFPGDVISVGGVVKEIAERLLVLDLQAKNQKGEITTTGIARFSR